MSQLDGRCPQVRALMRSFLDLTSEYTRRSDWCSQQSPPPWSSLIFDVINKHRMAAQPDVMDGLLSALLRPDSSSTEFRIANEVPGLVSRLARGEVSPVQAADMLNGFARRMIDLESVLMRMEPPGAGHRCLDRSIKGIEEARVKHGITDSALDAALRRLRMQRDLAAPLNLPTGARAGQSNQV